MFSWQRLAAAVLELVVMAAAEFGLAGGAAALPASYSGAEIRGWVVDAETKKPLEGVHVVAQWIVYTVTSPLQMHRGPGTPLQIMETVTDAKGEYYFPQWGPKPRPALSAIEWGSDPLLKFFKPGYQQDGRGNYSPPPDNEADMSQRFSRWHRQIIPLEPFRGTPQKWAVSLSDLQTSLGWGHDTDDVVHSVNDYWKYMPRMVLAIDEQYQLLPGPLKYRVRDLAAWHVTEAELRALIK
jgi:hypothetical protein